MDVAGQGTRCPGRRAPLVPLFWLRSRKRGSGCGAALLPSLGGPGSGWGGGLRAGVRAGSLGLGPGWGWGAARVLTLAPIWLPHWPAWMCTISLMLGACGGRLRDTRGRAGAGCGGSAAPAARSYRLGPARSAGLASPRAANRGTPPQNAARALQHQHRASRSGWAARCGAPPAVSARRHRGLGGLPRGGARVCPPPPHTEGRGWRAPGRTIEAPLGSRTPPRLPSRVLPLRQPQPTALQRRPFFPTPVQGPTPGSHPKEREGRLPAPCLVV